MSSILSNRIFIVSIFAIAVRHRDSVSECCLSTPGLTTTRRGPDPWEALATVVGPPFDDGSWARLTFHHHRKC